MRIAKDMEIMVAQKRISLKEFLSADEVFLTGTATEVASVGKINKRLIGDGKIGPITTNIRSMYLDIVRGNALQYKKWLSICTS
jgi:branched-chain amino acid aminotransferase